METLLAKFCRPLRRTAYIARVTGLRESRGNSFRSVGLLAASLLAMSACGGHVVDPRQPTRSCGGDPIRMVVGVGSADSDSYWKSAVDAVSAELKQKISPGFPGLDLSAYVLTDKALDATPLRLELPCINVLPTQPDPQHTSTSQRPVLEKQYEDALRNYAASRQAMLAAIDRFAQTMKAQQRSAIPSDSYAFLALASRQFESAAIQRPYLVLIGPDDGKVHSWCSNCINLRGAKAVLLGFDKNSPAEQITAEDQLNFRLRIAGASDVTFSRSNEPIGSVLN